MRNVSIAGIPAFSDNYIWCIHDETKAYLVDPGQAAPAQAYIDEHSLELEGILVTHHHPDHVGGIKELRTNNQECKVLAYSQSRFTGFDVALQDGEEFDILGYPFKMLCVPGHTLDHVAYYSELEDIPALFCGDTLFSAGCGRLFEGSAMQMHTSLAKLKSLPHETRVFCAHEYTLANLKFANALMPNNEKLKRYTKHCEALRSQGAATIPSTIAQELAINPFLRDMDSEIVENLRSLNYKDLNNAVDVFAAIRDAKDKS